ncbi:MAG: Hpt domain-containing protein [Leptospiraceae bacterium]|nr:Hpt domain-containing protein [Leptospiraceae bacterium]MCP5510439.1 Hpt domain-containing protein [Leptospiraceae bacterium]
MEIDLEEYRRQFYRESRDLIERANSGILKAETDPENDELLNSIFRDVHTIKGSAGSFELWKVSEFTHHLEGVLALLRDKKINISPDLVDVLLESLDYIEILIGDCENGVESEIDSTKVDKIKKFLLSDTPPPTSKPQPVSEEPSKSTGKENLEFPVPDSVKNLLLENYKEGQKAFYVDILYSDFQFQNGYDPLVLLRNIRESAVFYHCITNKDDVPSFDQYDSSKLYLKPHVYILTNQTEEEVIDLAFDPDLLKLYDITSDLIENNGIVEYDNLDNIDKDTLREFLISIDDLYQSINTAFLEYEKNYNKDSLNKLFRYIHTIKGDADYIGLSSTVKLVHELETLLEQLRNGSLQPNDTLTDKILSMIDETYDHIISLNQKLNRNTTIERTKKSFSSHEEQFEEFYEQSETTRDAFIEQLKQINDMLPHLVESISENPNSFKNIKRMINTLRVISENSGLKTLSDLCISTLGQIDSDSSPKEIESSLDDVLSFIDGFLNHKSKKVGEILVAEKKITDADLKEALGRQKQLGSILMESGKVSQADLEKALRKQEVSSLGKQLNTNHSDKSSETHIMKIEESKIDVFYNLIGELIVARNTYDFCLNRIQNQGVEDSLKSLKENLHVISRITNEMQRGVMSLRMVPVKTVFQKYYRVVRDVSRKQKKEIELIISGENVEIDKRVADTLSDPMVHLIRNACDHGIESAEERDASGKDPIGKITLRASYEGNHAVIRISDDGRGLNKDKIIEKANKMNIPTELLSDDDIYNLIFLPGLSTADKVTDVSGRGVGMDVVQSTARSLGGFVKIVSEKGKGSETIISIPISMGVSKALIIESDGNTFALPLENVIETIKIKGEEIHCLQDKMIFYFRGDVVHLEELTLLLDRERKDAIDLHDYFTDEIEPREEVPIVVLKTSFGRFAIIVDRLLKNMEIAIKPIPRQLGNIKVISGVTIMGDGGIVQVLNVEGLF